MKSDHHPLIDIYHPDSFSGFSRNDEDSNHQKSLYSNNSIQFLNGVVQSNYELSTEIQKSGVKIRKQQKKKQKNQEKDQNIENQDTKNLPSFFLRQFCDHILNREDLCQKIKKKIRKTKSESQTKASISQIRSLLLNQQINSWIKEYLTSFELVDDVLNSPKLLDVQTPIKYLAKLLEACNNPSSFTSWK